MRWVDLEGPVRSPRAWTQLLAGLFGFGFAIALMIRSELGLGSWDAFHQGLSRLTGISVGAASIVTGLVILAGSMTIGVRPGPGTLANLVLIGLFIDLVLPVVPAAPNVAWGLGYYAAGLLACGLATGFYIAAGLGKGPRDGLMLALAGRTGWSIRRVRTAIELSALAAGWAMGGTIGLGTILFTFGIGPAAQWGLALFPDRAAPPPSSEP